jgi:hypothetical protein
MTRQEVNRLAGQNLRRMRQRLGLTQSQAARPAVRWTDKKMLSDCGKVRVCQYETASRGLTLVQAWRFCAEKLNCSLEDILPTHNKAVERLPRAWDLSEQSIHDRIRYLRCMGGISMARLSVKIAGRPGSLDNHLRKKCKHGLSLWQAWRIACGLGVSLEDILPTGNATVGQQEAVVLNESPVVQG